jgi:hypothetical protein
MQMTRQTRVIIQSDELPQWTGVTGTVVDEDRQYETALVRLDAIAACAVFRFDELIAR